MTPNEKLQWWGYLHELGTIQAKRYFDRRDIEDAEASDFVQDVYGPFEATGRIDALAILTQHFKTEGSDV